MHIIYIIQSLKDLSYYTGRTTNLTKRIKDHNLGLSKYSSTKKPFKLIWYCVFNDKKKAIKFEKYLKSGSGIVFRNKRLI
ncbi:MAG TPA: GIY-YIG nuclease family protein [Candidatus Uhrbacteria bacterium]|nr:GIY-YIG nuclease family protein [Candidatus Uhrbacteria bacterium]